MATSKAPKARRAVVQESEAQSITGEEATVGVSPAEAFQAAIRVPIGGVIAIVPPGGVIITQDNGKEISYPAGTQTMPLAHATHWFAKARGVTIFEQD